MEGDKLPEKPLKQKTSAQLRKEKKEKEAAEAKKLGRELNRLLNILKAKFVTIERTGQIPDDGELQSYRKKLQFIASGIRKIRRARFNAPFGQGPINILLSKITKWIAGEGGKTGTTSTAEGKGLALDDILDRIRHATSATEPAVQEIIKILRAAAKERIMSGGTLQVAKRARRLMLERRRNEADIEKYLNDKFIVPVLSSIIDNFMLEIGKAKIILNIDVKSYIETNVIGGKSRREFISLLMRG